MNLATCTDWLRFISSEDRFFRENSITVHAYGDDDDTYLVVEKEVSSDPRIIDQYTISTANTNNKLFELLKFLSLFDFELEKLISKISTADYTSEGTNDLVNINNMEIARYQIQEN